jgi:uncharacterized protein
MFGTVVNTVAIVAGTLLGLLFKRFITEDLGKRVQLAFGFITLVIGLRMALKFENVVVLIGTIALGGIAGYLLNLEYQLERSAKAFQKMITRGKESSFATGLTIASILFCVGGMAIVGPINAGVMGNYDILFTKSLLDGITSAVLASIYGFGIMFAAVPVFLYQGGITLLASWAVFLNQPHTLAEISGVGGVLVMMIGVNLAKIQKVPVGDFLPALLLVVAWAFFA